MCTTIIIVELTSLTSVKRVEEGKEKEEEEEEEEEEGGGRKGGGRRRRTEKRKRLSTLCYGFNLQLE